MFYEVNLAFRSCKGRSEKKNEIIHDNKTLTLIIYFFLHIIMVLQQVQGNAYYRPIQDSRRNV